MNTYQSCLTCYAVHFPSLISGLVRLGITIGIICLIVYFIFRAMSKDGNARKKRSSSFASRNTSYADESIAKWRDRWFGTILGCQSYVILYMIIFLVLLNGIKNGSVRPETASSASLVMNIILIPFGLLATVFYFAFLYSKWKIGGVLVGILLLPLIAIPVLNCIIFIALLWITNQDGEPRITAGAGTFALLGTGVVQLGILVAIGALVGNKQQVAPERQNFPQSPLIARQQPAMPDMPKTDISQMREDIRTSVNNSIQANRSNPATPVKMNPNRTKQVPTNPYRRTTDYPQFAPIRDTLDSLEIALLPSKYLEKAAKFDVNGNGMLDNEDREFGAFANANAQALLADRDAFLKKQSRENSREETHEPAATMATMATVPAVPVAPAVPATPAVPAVPATPAAPAVVQPEFIDMTDMQTWGIPMDTMSRVYDADSDHDGRLSINERTQANLLDLVQYLPRSEPSLATPDPVPAAPQNTPEDSTPKK